MRGVLFDGAERYAADSGALECLAPYRQNDHLVEHAARLPGVTDMAAMTRRDFSRLLAAGAGTVMDVRRILPPDATPPGVTLWRM